MPPNYCASQQPPRRRRADAAPTAANNIASAGCAGGPRHNAFRLHRDHLCPTLSVALTSVFHLAPKLLWNVGASVPFGLHAVRRTLPLHVGIRRLEALRRAGIV